MDTEIKPGLLLLTKKTIQIPNFILLEGTVVEIIKRIDRDCSSIMMAFQIPNWEIAFDLTPNIKGTASISHNFMLENFDVIGSQIEVKNEKNI